MPDRIRVLYVESSRRSNPVAGWLDQRDDRIGVAETPDAGAGLDRVRAGAVDCVVAGHRPPDVDGPVLANAVVTAKVEYEPVTGEWNLTTKVPMYDDGEVTGLIGVTLTNVATGGADLRMEDDATVEAERNRLAHLLENQFRNAVEHGSTASRTESGDATERSPVRRTAKQSDDAVERDGPEVTVRVGVTDDGLYVEDDGRGIPAGERERVYDPAHSTSEDGTGFGLGIVEQMAETHGWAVRAVEGRDGGARFEVAGVDHAARRPS